jgi:PKD repeat protein
VTPEPTSTATDTRNPAPTPTVCRKNPFGWDYTWVVRPGETLFSIGRAVNETWETLMDANCLTSTIIHVGDELVVPRPRPTPIPTRTPKPTVAAPVIVTFTLDPPDEVALGDCVLLSWVVQGVIEQITLTADGSTLVADAPETGDYSDCPAEAGMRQYVLRAEGPDKNSYESRALTVIDESLPPEAGFSASPTSGEAPLSVSFTDQSTGAITGWAWTFGDGGSSTAQSPTHEYTAANVYTVELTVTGPGGLDSATASISVSEPTPPAPVAVFSANPTSGEAPLTVSFTDQSTGAITDWAWDFGDGGSSAEQDPSHQFTNAGDYKVKLTVTGPGGSNSATASISVSEPPPPAPVAVFSATPTSGEAPLTVSFTDQSTGAITDWAWDFGDGGSSVAQSPNHEYTAADDYMVTLTVTGPGGSDSDTTTIHVDPAPEAIETRGIFFTERISTASIAALPT